MDNCNFKFINNKRVLLYKGASFKFCAPQSNKTSIFKCMVTSCQAKVKLNPAKTRILDGVFVHTGHSPRPSNSSPTVTSNKENSNLNIVHSQSKSNHDKPNMMKVNPPKNQLSNRITQSSPNPSIVNKSTAAIQTPDNNLNKSKLPDKAVDNNLTDTSDNDSSDQHIASSILLIQRIEKLEIEIKKLTNKVDELSINANHSQSKLNHANSNSVQPQNENLSILNNSIKRVFFFSDSMGRGQYHNLKLYAGKKCKVFTMIKSGAKFADVIDSIPAICHDAGKDDAIIIVGGTNNLPNISPEQLSLKKLEPLAKRTNIVVCGISTRYDNSKINSKVPSANAILSRESKSLKCQFFDAQLFLKRNHFTRHGLHLNNGGKIVFALKCIEFIKQHICNVPLCDVSNERGSTNSIHSSVHHETLAHRLSSLEMYDNPMVPGSSTSRHDNSPTHMFHATDQHNLSEDMFADTVIDISDIYVPPSHQESFPDFDVALGLANELDNTYVLDQSPESTFSFNPRVMKPNSEVTSIPTIIPNMTRTPSSTFGGGQEETPKM